MSDKVVTGRCGCGAVSYSATNPLREPAICHCESCRKSSGAPFMVWFSVPVEDFRMLGEVVEHHSSAPVTRTRCASCGTPLTYFNTQRPGEIDVTHATLDEPQQLPPGYHIWLDDKPDWVNINDELPQFAQWRYS